QPGKLNIGTIAVGGTQNLGAELFKSMAGLNVQIVPYKNSPDIVVALLRNDVQMQVDFPPAVQGQVNDGKIRMLATASPQPSPLPTLKGVPTVDQAGVKGFEVISWNAVGAPKGTPKDVIATMSKAMHEVLAMPDVKEQFAKVGVVAHASSANEMMSRLTGDIKKWNDVVDKAGIQRKEIGCVPKPRGMMSRTKLSVAIVGAGMGGLAVAATLRRVGIDVQVYEQAARLADIGTGT